MGRRKKGDKVDGWFALDKPLEMTSTQALGKVRWLLNAQKAGHAGTLDPLATGVLPIALGEATKTIPFAQDHLKTYAFTARWGEARDTDDREGDVIETSEIRPQEKEILAALPDFTGDIEQTPPRFSAIKINGERAYDLARDGETFEIKSRSVYIEDLELLEMRADEADFVMTCGKGTYVRSLVRDLAQSLGTCGYVSALKRTKVGPFEIKDAISLEKLEEMGDNALRISALLPLNFVLDDIPALNMKQDETARLRNGNEVAFIAKPDFQRLSDAGIEDKDTALALFEDAPVALVERDGPHIRPVRVFNL
jgi:tRNA pseudouridine55 synthase